MKIIKKIIFEIETGKIIEEESFEYFGRIAKAGGGKKIKIPPPPGPSPQEIALQSKQSQLIDLQISELQRSIEEDKRFAPLFEPIQKGFFERTLAALQGKLPVNPALIRQLGEEENLLKEGLRNQLGPGFESSTPGIQALAEFNKRRDELIDAARRGDLTLGEQLTFGRRSSQPQLNIFGAGQGAGELNAPLSRFAAERAAAYNAQVQARLLGAQSGQQGLSSLFGGLGRLGGAFLGNPGLFGRP